MLKTDDINKWIFEQEKKVQEEKIQFELDKIKYESFNRQLNLYTELFCIQQKQIIFGLFFGGANR